MSIGIAILILVVLGVLAGLLLSIASIVMAVPKDEKAEQITEILPGANCGACGFSGCSGYAAALASGETEEAGLCAPGGAEVTSKISGLLGKGSGEFIKQTAVVRCQGNWEQTAMKMEYEGMPTCSAANQLFSGLGACAYGCIGFGDCKAVCEYGAIVVENGLAVVDETLCRACARCVKECPKGLIRLVPFDGKTTVLCSNHDKGAKTRKVCKTGCIGCGKCMKVCSSDAVKVEAFLASIDPEKCTGCGECVKACPQGCIE